MDRSMEERWDIWMDGWMDGWKGGQMDRCRKKPAVKTEAVILTPIITIPLKITLRAKPAFKTLK